jgi:hypothetical protein
MTVAGGFQGLPHFLGESLGDGDDVIGAHGSPWRLSDTFAARREPYPVPEKTSNGFLRWNFSVRKACPGLKKGIAAP